MHSQAGAARLGTEHHHSERRPAAPPGAQHPVLCLQLLRGVERSLSAIHSGIAGPSKFFSLGKDSMARDPRARVLTLMRRIRAEGGIPE